MEHLSEDDFMQQFLADNTRRVKIPKGAVDLFPSKIGTRILHLPDTDQILKAGARVKLSEAEAMQLVKRETSIPVPHVHILVGEHDRITAIIDWEGAGYSIPGRDYYEAQARARDPGWSKALGEVFSWEAKAQFELLKELDQALVRYTCI